MNTENKQDNPEIIKTTSGQYGNVLYEWESFNDFNTERSLNWTAAMLLLEIIFLLIAIIARQWLLLTILVGVAVITYLISRYPPKKTYNVITTLGVILDGKLLKWSELESFWILQEPIHIFLGFETRRNFNKDEAVLIDNEDPGQLIGIISNYLPQKEKEMPLMDIFLEVIGYRVRLLFEKLFAKKIK